MLTYQNTHHIHLRLEKYEKHTSHSYKMYKWLSAYAILGGLEIMDCD